MVFVEQPLALSGSAKCKCNQNQCCHVKSFFFFFFQVVMLQKNYKGFLCLELYFLAGLKLGLSCVFDNSETSTVKKKGT